MMQNEIVQYGPIKYGSDPNLHNLCIYRPKEKAGETLPVIVQVHDGLWEYGDEARLRCYCMSLALHGFAVIHYTCRPASLKDTNRVFGWVLAHAAEYGLDTQHLFAVGDSGGARLLGIYACILTNPDCTAPFPFTMPEDLALCGITLNNGSYSQDVLSGITEAFPTTLVLTSTGDTFLGQALRLNKTLVEKNVSHELFLYGNADPEWGNVFRFKLNVDTPRAYEPRECEFFQFLL